MSETFLPLSAETPPVGAWYRAARLRLVDRLQPLDDEQWLRPVPACPGWRVRDVLAHLVGIIEDAFAGDLDGPPSPAQTAAEVERHLDDAPTTMLEWWADASPSFEDAISQLARWPAFFDVLSHEHDVRGALGERGPRGGTEVDLAAELLIDAIRAPRAIEFDLGTRILPAANEGRPLSVRTTSFEILRFRLGRRTRAQVACLDWSADPESVLDHLFIFGPAAEAFDD